MRRTAGLRVQRRGTLPPLRPGDDAQRIRVLALLAPARERRTWRRQLLTGTTSRRAAAAVALGAVQGAGAVLILGRAVLRDESPFVRRMSAEALGLVGGRAAAHALLRAAHERVPSVRAAVLRALGRCGVELDDAVIPLILDGLGCVDARVCEAALLALAEWRHPLLLEHAKRLSRHTSPLVRRAAVSALGELPEARASLLAAQEDPDPAAASIATELLRALRAG